MPAQLAALIDDIKREVEAETAKKKAAQPGVRAALPRAQQRSAAPVYACACCVERNKKAAGEYTGV